MCTSSCTQAWRQTWGKYGHIKIEGDCHDIDFSLTFRSERHKAAQIVQQPFPQPGTTHVTTHDYSLRLFLRFGFALWLSLPKNGVLHAHCVCSAETLVALAPRIPTRNIFTWCAIRRTKNDGHRLTRVNNPSKKGGAEKPKVVKQDFDNTLSCAFLRWSFPYLLNIKLRPFYEHLLLLKTTKKLGPNCWWEKMRESKFLEGLP